MQNWKKLQGFKLKENNLEEYMVNTLFMFVTDALVLNIYNLAHNPEIPTASDVLSSKDCMFIDNTKKSSHKKSSYLGH